MTTDEPTLNQNKASSRRLYVEVFGRGNLDVADEILAPACVNHGPGVPPTTGTQGIKAQALVLRSAFPDLQPVLADQFAAGDRVLSRWSATGTHTGDLRLPWAVLPPTGKSIAFGEFRIDRYEDGRVVEDWFMPDRFSLWLALGLIPTTSPTGG